MHGGTITLGRADDACRFERGANAMDLPEQHARAILGDAVYETIRDLTGVRQ